MVASSATAAVRNAYAYSSCWPPGRCLQYVRTWLQIPPHFPSATAAWEGAEFKHHGDRHPPKAAPCFWTGGSHGYGHITLAVGDHDGWMRSTDVPHAGMVRSVPLTWFDQHWPALHYVGWAEDLGGVHIPWLAGHPLPAPPPPPPSPPTGDAWMGTIDAISPAAAAAIGTQTAIQVWTRYQPGSRTLSDWLYATGASTEKIAAQNKWIMEAVKAIAAKQGVTLPPPPA